MANGLFRPQPILTQPPNINDLLRIQQGQGQQALQLGQFLQNRQGAQAREQRAGELHPLQVQQTQGALETQAQQREINRLNLAAGQLEARQAATTKAAQEAFNTNASGYIRTLTELKSNFERTDEQIDKDLFEQELFTRIQEAGFAGLKPEWLLSMLETHNKVIEEEAKAGDVKGSDFKELFDPETGKSFMINVKTREVLGETPPERRTVGEATQLIQERGKVQKKVAETKSKLRLDVGLKILERRFKVKEDFEKFKLEIEKADFSEDQLDALFDAAVDVLDIDRPSKIQQATLKKNIGILNVKAPERYADIIRAVSGEENKGLFAKLGTALGGWGDSLSGRGKARLLPRRGKQSNSRAPELEHLYK